MTAILSARQARGHFQFLALPQLMRYLYIKNRDLSLFNTSWRYNSRSYPEKVFLESQVYFSSTVFELINSLHFSVSSTTYKIKFFELVFKPVEYETLIIRIH
jgi:hypothetical protein